MRDVQASPVLTTPKEPPFEGTCSLCGKTQIFKAVSTRSIRDEYPCEKCRATIRFRDQASVIIDEYGRGKALSLDKLVSLPSFAKLVVYETSLQGPFIKYFSRLPKYIRSYFWEDMALGDLHDGVRNEDLRNLTLADNSIDLIITSDVLEHVFDYRRAMEEIHRVLRPGGLHVFAIPTNWPIDDRTTARAIKEDGKIVHLREERYHVAGDRGRSLVVTDFGADLLDELDAIGLRTAAIRRSMPLFPGHRVLTFVSRKGF